MGYAVNTLIVLTGATLGLCLTIIRDTEFHHYRWGGCAVVGSGALLMLSIAFGFACTLNRLKDFRESADIARLRENMGARGFSKSWIDDKLRHRRNKNKRRGEISRSLFHCQIGTFGGGTLFLMIAFLISYGERLA